VVPKRQGSGPPPQRPAPDTCSTSGCHSASPPQSSEDGQGPPKRRPTAAFWQLYYQFVAGEHGGPPDDPGNYWCFGALSCPVDRYDLPPEVVTAWERTAAAYASYVGLVAVFDTLDPRWERWHAVRKALPDVRHEVLRRLLAALDGVPTETLVELCDRQSGVSA
jgi:hypothetical protein